MTSQLKPRIKVADQSVRALKEKLRRTFHRGQGRNLGKFIEQELNPALGLILLLDLLRRAQRAT